MPYRWIAVVGYYKCLDEASSTDRGYFIRRLREEMKRIAKSRRERSLWLPLASAFILAAASVAYSIFRVHLLHTADPAFRDAGSAPFRDGGKPERSQKPLGERHHGELHAPAPAPALPHTNAHSHSHSNSLPHREEKSPRKFFRYDEAGPKPIHGTARSHALPNAVPYTNIIPREQAENKSYHISQRSNTSEPLSFVYPHPLEQRKLANEIKQSNPELHNLLGRYNWNHTHDDDYRTIYLYNPSVLPLHNTVLRQAHGAGNSKYDSGYDYNNDRDPDSLSAAELQELTGGDPRVRYVATYRAYLGCNCFARSKSDRSIMTAGEQLSYLAVALLDESLDVIEGTDVLIDLNAGPSQVKYFRQPKEDCRIFLLRGGIYLVCNEEMKRIRIKRQGGNKPRNRHPTAPPPGYGTGKGIPTPYIYPNIHGNGLEITILSHNGKIYGGKNLNIFRTPAKSPATKPSATPGTEYDYYLQTFPSPHRYKKLQIHGGGPENENRPPGFSKGARDESEPRGKLPRPTFDTPDAPHNVSLCADNPKTNNCSHPVDVPFFEVREDHGTACCVRVVLPPAASSRHEGNGTEIKGGREVMVGITHQKLSQRNNFWLLDVHKRYEHLGIDRFVSRFVAYNPLPPFETVARSGWFCLGFADAAESDGRFGNSLAGKNLDARLDLFDQTYDCPIIHFASGFSEVVGNSSRAIISYGVNDCHPRMFFVDKDEIVRLLTQ